MRLRGATVYVELAIVLPVLLLLVFSAIALGLAVVMYVQLANAVTLAMQQMMVDGCYSDRARDVLAESLRSAGLSLSDVYVDATPCPPRPYGEMVYMRIVYRHRIALPWLQGDIPFDLTVRGTSAYVPPPSP